MPAPEALRESAAGPDVYGQPELFLESRLLSELGVRHGFFTRSGGVSRPPFDSLNCSLSVGDDALSVQTNRERAARAVGVAPERVFRVSQVHGSDVIVVVGGDVSSETAKRPGDAVVCGAAGSACAVITADCVPILVASRTSGYVAAIHSGWRGFVAGVISQTMGALTSLGVRDLVAAIGPHISAAAFEVSFEVALELQALAPGVPVMRSTTSRPHVDLRALAHAQLRSSGLGEGDIDDVFGCTFLEPERFFSYRRDGAQSGRQLAAIVSRDAG